MRIKYGKKVENNIREAVRAVLIKNNHIGLIKVEKYDCYIFPGGGVEKGEDLEKALVRECLEEAGYKVNVKEKLLETESGEYMFTHLNHYYLCEIVDEVEPSYTELEQELNIRFEWVPIVDAYKYYLQYQDDVRFGEENTIIQRSIRSRGFLLMSLLNKRFSWGLESNWLGKDVSIIIDRPVGYVQKLGYDPYPINYGYIENIFSLDGKEVDCYYIDSDVALTSVSGKVVAVVRREDDVEDKLVISNENPTIDEVKKAINFIEQYFNSIIIM